MAQNKDLKLFEVILNEESLELLEGLDSYEYQDVSLYHDNLDSNTLKGIEKCIDAAMQRIPDIYTNIEHTNLTFILHSDSAEFETINSGGDIQGFFNFIDKTLNMPFLKDSVIDEEFENIFKHEYNHFLIDKIRMENDIDENTIPLWFEEGVSEFYAYGNEFEKFLDYAYEEEFLNIAFTFVEYEKLKTSKNWKARSDRGYYPYTQSYYAICKLVKKNGAKAIENIIINSAKLGFEKSFKQETKISLKEFLDECKSKFIEEFDVKVENIMN
ncbi:hypothetical protein [uncultured Clostridium sp.]|uniref:hypothetical protein n=1 Tax=uncultured Clostridium sp. TaxID=59620 RepID=UPI00261BCEA0|nr:hypothetical protein [uncultured Clostridium sp.]